MNASELTSKLVLAEANATAQVMVKDVDTNAVRTINDVTVETHPDGTQTVWIEAGVF